MAIKIIRFRPFGIKDLQYVRLIKPFEDAGLVIDFEHDINHELDLIYDVCNDTAITNFHYDHLLLHSKSSETPSTLFTHIHNRDEQLPILWSYHEVNGTRVRIQAIKNYHDLQKLLGLAAHRGYVTDTERLL